MERPTFPLLNETLNFLKNDVVGKVSNIVRNKNRFIFHVIFEEYEKINDKSFNIDLIKENCIPFDSNVEPGLLFSCLHPNTKKWVRCYVLSISQGQAIVALIDTGEVTKTKKLKEIPDKYKNIPAITFQGEVRCISPPGILRHLMENYQDYVAYFQSFRITSDSEVYKKMFLSYEGNVMVDFIVKKWDPMLIVNDTNDNSMTFKNGCTVIMAKSESYDSRHVFVRSIDKFVRIFKEVEAYCSKNDPYIGNTLGLEEIVGVKYSDKFYRGKIVDILGYENEQNYVLYLIDSGLTISTNTVIVLPQNLKEIPPSVCLIGLKDITRKPLTPEAQQYIKSLFDNSTTMILEFNDNDTFGLDSVSLTIINNNQDVNGYIEELLQSVEETTSTNEFTPYHSVTSLLKIPHQNILNTHTCVDTANTDTQVKLTNGDDKSTLLSPGSLVYMSSFVNLTEIFVRKLEDDNDEFNFFLGEVDVYCSTAEPIQRNLVVDEMVGAKSPLDGSFYRGTVLKQVDNENYLIRFIDYGDKDTVHKSNIVDLPPELMVPTNVSAITLKGIVSNKLTPAAKDYIANLLQTYEPMIINFDPSTPLKDVVLITENGNENVNDHLRQLLNDEEENVINESEIAETENIPNVVNVDVHNVASTNEKYNVTNPLKSGDIVYITAYIDLNNIYVRKVDDNNEEFEKLLERVNTYCSLGNTSDSKPPDLLEIVGAKSISDGCFYRAKVTGKINEKNYNIVFVDFGYEECVNVADIVLLPVELQQLTPTIHLVGLKGANSISLNDSVNKYMEGLFSETMRVEFEDMNAVTLTIINQEQDIVNHINSLLTEIVNDDTNLNLGTQNKCSEIVLPRVPELTNQSVVTINSFVNKTDIYIKVCYDKSKMDKFLKDFSFYCASVNPLASQPTIGEIYGIQSSIDGLYYRGVIEEKLSNNQFKVIFFEIDTKDVVSTKSIVEIPNNLKQIPRSIYLVNLQGVDIRSLNARGLSYLNMLCENNVPLVIEFTQYAINSLFFVTLKTVDTNENINEHLIKLLAKNERNSPETVQVLSKGDIVYISSFDNFQNISVRRINNGTDKFKSFLENFSSSCSLEKPIDRVPRIGEIIAARQNAGSKFHRAEVIDAVNSENYNVCFIDYGSRETVHISNIVQPSDHQLKTCATSFLINLEGLPSEPLNKPVLHFINNIIKTDTFIIDSITSQNQAVLVSVNTKENLNDKIKSLLANCNTIETVNKNEKCDSEMKQFEKSIIKYSKLPLNIPNQVWVVDKISSSAYIVHTIDSRLEFERLGNIMFKDGETFQPVDKIKMNMQCAVLFSTTWHRGEVLEIIDECTARINLIDVTKVSVVCDIKEIFSLSPKYQGKSLLTKIIIQPEPHEMLYNTFKVIAKKHLEDSTVVKLVEASTNINQSYGDLNNVGYPSFSSTPIPNGGNEFDFNKDLSTPNDGNLMNGNVSQIQPLEYKSPVIQSPNRSLTPNIFTIKDVQYARWLKGSSKTLTFLCQHKDYLLMRDHLVDDAVADLEVKLQEYCVEVAYPYSPAIGELCLAKFDDGLWYRALCTKISEDDPSKNIFTVHFLDWGLEYSVDAEDLRKMSSDFAYLPASAIKCYIKDADVSKWSDSTLKTLAQLMLTQFSCIIFDKISIDSYSIKCDYIYNLVQSNQELATI